MGKKAQRHALQMFVHLLAQIENETFTGAGTVVALHHADQTVDHGDADHAERHPIEAGKIAVRQHIVDQIAIEQRRNQAEQRGNDNGA